MVAEEHNTLHSRIYELMVQLPDDKVTTYGDLAAFAGHPYAARRVGEIAHGGPEELPWHRLVNCKGGLAVGFPGGRRCNGNCSSMMGSSVMTRTVWSILRSVAGGRLPRRRMT